MAAKFEYMKLGVARIVDEDGESHPIEGNYIFNVRLKSANGRGRGRVLGCVQENPSLRNQWCAVAATGDTFPVVDFERGLWSMTPGKSGFSSKREASMWLLGASDARQAWFKEGEK